MKQPYIQPELEVIVLEELDVITTSPTNPDPDEGGHVPFP